MAIETGSVSESEAPPAAREVELTPTQREELVTKKATCPWIVHTVKLALGALF
jgi:hypothetical protein